MTSAINGRIVFKQGPRNYLEANIRRNSLVFDTDNNILLYSPSGTDYYEFYPGQGGGVSGTVYWNDIIGEPLASTSTSGVLTSSDWNKFNNKADISAIPSTSSFVTSSYVNTQIQNIPLASTSTSGVLTSSDWNKFNNKADISAIPTSSTIQDLIYLYSHPSITLRNSVSTTTPSATSANLVSFPINFIPNILAFQLVGQSSGSYSASANIYASSDNVNLILLATGVIDNINSVDGAILLNSNGYTSFASDISVSGTTSGISVKVVS